MIHARSLTKTFSAGRSQQPVHAVRGIDLDVAPHELVAVLGPNGAGKTTTMRMLTTLLPPTSGTAAVAGFDVLTQPGQVRRRIGYVGQHNGAGHNQRVIDELATQGVIYGLGRSEARTRATQLLDALDLGPLGSRKVNSLSGGQRRRLDVAMGLMHAPSLLFLDEPSTGLDPQTRANLWQHILTMRNTYAMTILLTTHYLDEADAMAERVVVVDHGQVIADDTAPALKANLAGDRLVLRAGDTAGAGTLAALVARIPGASEVQTHGAAVTGRVPDGTARLPEVLRAADAAGASVRDAEVIRPTLDDVFLNLTGRSLREDITTEEVAA